MSRWINVDEHVNQYITDHLPPEHPVLQALHARTAGMQGAGMQIGHEQAQFMRVALRSMQARRTIEIGVYTGYSTLITAQSLPEDGNVIACDISKEWTDIARPFWQQAGVAHKIDLRLAPAADTLAQLLREGGAGQFDFVFIDADKTGYDHYYEQSLRLLRQGGLIMLDNCLWGGAVLDVDSADEDTQALRQLNRKIAADDRVTASLVPVGDGIQMVCKR